MAITFSAAPLEKNGPALSRCQGSPLISTCDTYTGTFSKVRARAMSAVGMGVLEDIRLIAKLPTGKPTTHVPTTQSCDVCHSTSVWKPAVFNHSGITSGCLSCHNGVTTYGGMLIGFKAASHWVTARDCNYCHAYPAWMPLSFLTTRGGQGSHQSLTYPGDHTGTNPVCTACHTGHSDAVPYRNATYAGTCAGCHSSSYKSDPHTKYGTVKYTVSELKNCSGACHIYTDATLSVIKTRRAGPQHKVTARDF